MDAELVLERHAAQIVALPKRAVVVDQKLRHQEQRDAACAGRRVRQPREHHVDDVVGVVVLAEGDEDLGAADAVVVALVFGARLERADVLPACGSVRHMLPVHSPLTSS